MTRHVTKLRVERYDVTGADASGQPVGAWRVRGYWYATVKSLSGRQVDAARQLYDLATHELVGHFNADIDERSRLRSVDNARVFAVGAVDNVENRNRELRVIASENRSA